MKRLRSLFILIGFLSTGRAHGPGGKLEKGRTVKTQKSWTIKSNVLLSLAMFALLNVLMSSAVAGKLAGTPGKAAAHGRNAADDDLNQPRFRVRSNTFQNNTVMPQSMVFNGTLGSVCTGGNTSPDLEWTSSLPWTKSYTVVVYDETGEFTHWGVYNIPPNVNRLPSGAGSLDANGNPVISFPQISNDTFTVGYVGPCPPANVQPLTHKYRFTVYALDTTFDLPQFNGFLAPSETLFRAMIGHVIETTTITALLSCENMGSACS
jgi:Raf kinase inhibitor-like YbhB/YbcL family protein